MLQVMGAARWWVLLFAMLLMGLVLMEMVGAVLQLTSGGATGASTMTTLVRAGMVAVSGGMASLLLLIYFARVGAFVASGRAFELVDAVKTERIFWMVASLLALLWIVLLLILVGMAIMAASALPAPEASLPPVYVDLCVVDSVRSLLLAV